MTTTIDKNLCQALRIEIQDAIDAVTKKHGLNVKIDKMKYNDTSIEFKVNLSNESEEESGRSNWNLYCEQYGLGKDMFGKEFKHDGDNFKITNWNQKARKNKIKFISTITGKHYHSSVEFVLHVFKL